MTRAAHLRAGVTLALLLDAAGNADPTPAAYAWTVT